MSAPAPGLPADLTAGLRRLKLAAMRELFVSHVRSSSNVGAKAISLDDLSLAAAQ